jgi:hypothetical protein
MNEEQLAKFARNERENIETLERRRQYLHDSPASVGGQSYINAEIAALTWVLDVVLAGIQPLDTRVQRLEQQMRGVFGRLGKVERDLREDSDEDEED